MKESYVPLWCIVRVVLGTHHPYPAASRDSSDPSATFVGCSLRLLFLDATLAGVFAQNTSLQFPMRGTIRWSVSTECLEAAHPGSDPLHCCSREVAQPEPEEPAEAAQPALSAWSPLCARSSRPASLLLCSPLPRSVRGTLTLGFLITAYLLLQNRRIPSVIAHRVVPLTRLHSLMLVQMDLPQSMQERSR